MGVPFLACMVAVAVFNHLPPRVLPSIQAVEGGAIGTVHRNLDGSDDLGVMQVNTRWIGPLAEVSGLSEDVVRGRLVGDGCFNIAAAGVILRSYLIEAGGDMMRAIGYYHSHTPGLGQSYEEEVLRSALRLFLPMPATNGGPDRVASR